MVSERDVAARLRRLAALLSVGQVAALADKVRDQYVPAATQRAEGTNNQHLLDYVNNLSEAGTKLTSIQQNLELAAEALNSYSEAPEEDKGLGPNFSGVERNPKRPLSGKKPKAESAKGETKQKETGGDLGSDWFPRSVTSIRPGSSECKKVAKEIQSKIGGEIKTILPMEPFPLLSAYRKREPEWGMHKVVVKDGRVYDAWTEREGMPIEDYKRLWEFSEDINFGF